ncbi:MAG: hypothetical protein M0R17_00685 [Candidatus Omnitrophica bacterium]|jgi:hypothetical protein|nr:hypothetical protein [Candidatus Omnitrophota bacterium]
MRETITSHQLAKALLEDEDLPILMIVNGHTYSSEAHKYSHGEIKLGISTIIYASGYSKHIVIGHMLETEDNIMDIRSINKDV